MWKNPDGSTGRLIQLCVGYFLCYTLVGVLVKYFLAVQKMDGLVFTTYNTAGGTLLCLSVVLVLGWYKLKSNRSVQWGHLSFPREYLYILPSGVFTAVVITTTTLMYTLPISIMVAMVIMRGSVIVASRAVDFVQTRQGILKKKVYWEENLAIAFALLAIAIKTILPLFKADGTAAHFVFFKQPYALTIFGSYITAYAIRIYIMNYYKNTRDRSAPQDNKGFFAVEQISASLTLTLVMAFIVLGPSFFGETITKQITVWSGTVTPDTAQVSASADSLSVVTGKSLRGSARLELASAAAGPVKIEFSTGGPFRAATLSARPPRGPDTLTLVWDSAADLGVHHYPVGEVRLRVSTATQQAMLDGMAVDNTGASTRTLVSYAWFNTETHPPAGRFQLTEKLETVRRAASNLRPFWFAAFAAGTVFGVVAFFSVFIFMYKGRTATFAGLVNRLTSLLAGTSATLLTWALFGTKFPKPEDWISLASIMVAVAILARAERKRTAELAQENA